MNDLWRICLHESGHAVAAWVQGGRIAAVTACESGGAADFVCSDATAHAIAIAAGPAADALLADVPPPELPDAPRPAAELPAVSLAAAVTHAAATGRGGPSDAVQLARWAISGFESEPGRWEGRVLLAHRTARKIVSDHREKIIALAAELFSAGELSGQQVYSILEAK